MKNSTKLNIFHVIRVAADFKLAMLEKNKIYMISSKLIIYNFVFTLIKYRKW